MAPRQACQITPLVGLGGEHRDRVGVDQVGRTQMPGAGGAAGLLVADEVQDDLAIVEQAQFAGAAAP
jgi:hypothetical protein